MGDISVLANALLTNKGVPMPPIPWHMQARGPLEEDRVRVLGKNLQAHGSQWIKCEANESAIGLLPDCHGLYMFVWRVGPEVLCESLPGVKNFRYVLYVGKVGPTGGNTIRKRFQAEYLKYIKGSPDSLWFDKFDSREDRLRRLLQLRPLEVWACRQQGDVRHITQWEGDLVEMFSPPGNKHQVISCKLKKAQSAF